MPLRSRRTLLAGMGAMVGLCLAGTGCQSGVIRTDRFAAAPDVGAVAQPIVSILRPISANSGPVANAGAASAWQPVQRASAEELPARQPAAGTVQVGAQGTLPMPTPVETPVPIEVTLPVGPVTGDKPADKPGADDKDPAILLHPPTPLGGAPVVMAHPVGAGGPPKEFSKQSLPPYVVEPPDILLIESGEKILDQPVAGQHLVRPDGYVSLGRYGEVYVAGMNLAQVRAAVTAKLREAKETYDGRVLNVDVIAYNSKVYYLITDGGGYGQQVYRIPVTGNETILDAMAQIQGLPAVASKKKIWLARATPDGHPIILPVDWRRVTMCGSGATNYQVFPGDRIYVGADPWIMTDSWLAKRLAPVERLLGITLLGSSTVNSIRTGTNAGTGVP